MRRLFALLAVVAGLTIAASPALAADVQRITVSGIGITAISSNAEVDSEGQYLPGTYQELLVGAYHLVFTAGNDEVPYLEEAYAIVMYSQFTVDEAGLQTSDWSIQASAPYDTLTVDRMLTSGHVVASVPAVYGVAGTFEIDLSATGVGRLTNDPSNAAGSGGGVPGVIRTAYGGFGWTRAADLTGTVTLGGESVIVGGSWDVGELSRGTGVQILVVNP